MKILITFHSPWHYYTYSIEYAFFLSRISSDFVIRRLKFDFQHILILVVLCGTGI